MEFTYKVEQYIQSENRLFVVYTPTDTSLPAWGNWVAVDDSMNEDAIKQAIVQAVPLFRWQSSEITAAKNLINHSETATFVPPAVTEQEAFQEPSLAKQERMRRDFLLRQSDWTVLPDAPISEQRRQAFLAYRQLLREIPQQSGFPDNIVWPEKP